MPIGFDAFTYSAQGVTYNHTCTGSNRILFAVTRGLCSGVTYGGVALTLIDQQVLEGGIAAFTPLKLWYLVNPPVGLNSVSCADSCTASMVASYNGVHQTTPLNAEVLNSSPGVVASLTTSVTTTVNQCWIVVAEASYAFGPPPQSGTNLLYRGAATASSGVGALFDSNGPKTPAGLFSGTTNQSGSAEKIKHIMQAFAPVVSSGPPDKPPKKDKPGVGVPTVLIGGTTYATPIHLVNIEWNSSGAAILEGSMDEVAWVTLGSLASAGNLLTTDVIHPYIRPSANITVILRKRKGSF